MPNDLNAITLPYLRAWRIRRGLLQAELAERAKVTPATISRLETGGKVRLGTVARLAEALGVSREDLLHSEPKKDRVPAA